MKSKGTTLILCIFLGWLGIHRFYVGKWLSGIIQLFTFGGFGIWWFIDFLLILLGSFRDSSGKLIGGNDTPATLQGSSGPPTLPNNSAPTDGNSWVMEPKPTSALKFLLGANFMKRYQLHSVIQRDDQLTVKVNSGKSVTFKVGHYKAKFSKTKVGNRDFSISSTTGPKQKIGFRENPLQMPEAWWDELAIRLGAAESGLSKILHATQNALDGVNDIRGEK